MEHGARVSAALNRVLIEHAVAPDSDVVLVQFAIPFGSPVATAAAARGLRYVVYLRGDDVWIWPHENERRRRDFVTALRSASLILATSEALLREAARLCGGALPPHTALANGIDLARFRPGDEDDRLTTRSWFGIEPSELVVLCVAAPIARKGWVELFEALETVAAGGVRPTLIAAIARAEPEFDIAREASVRAPTVKVIAMHDLAGQQLADVYRAADVFCLPSYGEGMSNAVMEAMASGLAVITTAVGGHSEIIRSGIDGLLVQPRDRQALIAALQRVLTNPHDRMRLGRAARLRAELIGDSRRAGRLLSGMLSDLLHSRQPDVSGIDAYGSSPIPTPQLSS
jgi:glycosyltransferase involved in cell wall biosynthesis